MEVRLHMSIPQNGVFYIMDLLLVHRRAHVVFEFTRSHADLLTRTHSHFQTDCATTTTITAAIA